MKTVIIVGAVGLAAYYLYQKFVNPNATPESVLNSAIAQVNNVVAQPSTLVSSQVQYTQPVQPVQQKVVATPIPTPVPTPTKVVTNLFQLPASPAVLKPKPAPISAVIMNNPATVRIIGINGLRGLL